MNQGILLRQTLRRGQRSPRSNQKTWGSELCACILRSFGAGGSTNRLSTSPSLLRKTVLVCIASVKALVWNLSKKDSVSIRSEVRVEYLHGLPCIYVLTRCASYDVPQLEWVSVVVLQVTQCFLMHKSGRHRHQSFQIPGHQ